MNGRAKITGIMLDFIGKRTLLQMEVDSAAYDECRAWKESDVDLDVKITKHREKRSLDANSYYWVLLSKLAAKRKVTNNFMHNFLLRRYGVPEMIGDQVVYVVLPDDSDEDIMEKELYHLKPTSQVKTGTDGRMYRTYVMLKGSKDFDTSEMARLIDGTVSECREQGIETMPPDELMRMVGEWQR